MPQRSAKNMLLKGWLALIRDGHIAHCCHTHDRALSQSPGFARRGGSYLDCAGGAMADGRVVHGLRYGAGHQLIAKPMVMGSRGERLACRQLFQPKESMGHFSLARPKTVSVAQLARKLHASRPRSALRGLMRRSSYRGVRVRTQPGRPRSLPADGARRDAVCCKFRRGFVLVPPCCHSAARIGLQGCSFCAMAGALFRHGQFL